MICAIGTSTGGTDPVSALFALKRLPVRHVLSRDFASLPERHLGDGHPVLGVIAAETWASFGLDVGNPQHDRPLLEAAHTLWSPRVTFYEIANEPDLVSMMNLSPARFESLLKAACAVFHAGGSHVSPQLISGGLGSGGAAGPAYLRKVIVPRCYWVGVHAYNSRIETLPGVFFPDASYGFQEIHAFLNAFGAWAKHGLALTEWGTTDDDPGFVVPYISLMLDVLRSRSDTRLASWFSLSDNQAGSPHGLVRRDGTPKPQLEAYRQETQTMPEFKLGFKTFAAQHPEVGKALSDELYVTADWSQQIAEGGVLHYTKLDNTTRFHPFPKA